MPWHAKKLVRRSDTAEKRVKVHLPESSFWRTSQADLEPLFLADEYDKDTYCEVMLQDGRPQTHEIATFLDSKGGSRFLLLVGQFGAGKTSMLKHYAATAIGEANAKGLKRLWLYVDFNALAARLEPRRIERTLVLPIASALEDTLHTLGLSLFDFHMDLYDNGSSFAYPRTIYGDALTPAEKQRKVTHALEEPANYLDTVFEFFTRRLGGDMVVLVLDNLDPLDPVAQAEAIKRAKLLVHARQFRTIVAVRQETEDLLRYHDRELVGSFIRAQVAAPRLSEVFGLRLRKALLLPAFRNLKSGIGAVQFSLRKQPVENLARQLYAEATLHFLDGLANGSVRQGLRIWLSLFASPHLEEILTRTFSPTREIDGRRSHHIPHHLALKAIILRTAQIYDPSVTWAPNIFGQGPEDSPPGVLLRLLILRRLSRMKEHRADPDALIADVTAAVRAEKSLVEHEVAWLLDKDLIERFRNPKEVVHLSTLGEFMLAELMFQREYLCFVATDVFMYEELERDLVTIPTSRREEIANLRLMLDYVIKREAACLRFLSERGLASYFACFGAESIAAEFLRVMSKNVASFGDYVEAREVSRLIEELEAGKELATTRTILHEYDTRHP
jgi:hypothetical protein